MSSIYSAEYIIYKLKNSIQQQTSKIHLYDDIVINKTTTLTLLAHKGCICRRCKLQANYFVYNDGDGTYKPPITIGFHAVYKTRSGKFIPFTKDHIYPASKGGANITENLQVLCKNCNSQKDTKMYFKHNDYELMYHLQSFFHSWMSYIETSNPKFKQRIKFLQSECIKNRLHSLNKEDLLLLLRQNNIANIPKQVDEKGSCKFIKFKHSHIIRNSEIIEPSLLQKIIVYFSKYL